MIAGLVAALGVALLMSGHVLIGGLILALAVARLSLFLTMRHRATGGVRPARPATAGAPDRGGTDRPYGRADPVPYDPPA